MSSIPYSGGTIINTTFTTTTGTRQEIVTALETQLTAAGWSVISGSGTGTVVMKSAVTPTASNSIRVRLLEVGSGNCAQIKIENDAGTLTSQAFYLLPAAGKVFRIIACKYNFFCFMPQPSTSRGYVAAGTLHLPPHLVGVTTGDLGWIQGNGNSDSSTSISYTFRTQVSGVHLNNSAGLGWCAQIWNNALTNCVDDNNIAAHRMRAAAEYPAISTYGLVWSDDSSPVLEAMLGFGSGATSAVNKWRGFIHNALVTAKVYAGDDITPSAYDGHAWMSITDNCTAGINTGRAGSLLVAIS